MKTEKQKASHKKWILNNKDKIKEYQKKYILENKDRVAEYRRVYQNQYNKDNSETYNAYRRNHYKTDPEFRRKQAVRHLTQSRFYNRKIDLSKKVCQVPNCEEHGLIHHWDYNEPMDISFICKKHHLEIHSGNIPEGIIRHF